ncbi:MAG: glycosyltransferase family 2 protein [Candidatus Cloacimonadota bacterium]|nr:glycosyltransferase family 2 protein [Candidatus Cloacimonadota bacterium]
MKKAKIENTAVIIANYNHGKYIKKLVSDINQFFPFPHIYIVDDCSTDNSLRIIESLISKKINILKHKRNFGKGATIKTGFYQTIEDGFDFAITIDADLQHQPKYLTQFMKKQNNRNSQLVIGARDICFKKMPFMRVLSNKITSSIVSIVTQRKILDSQSGYRLYDLSSFNLNKLVSNRYQFETEIILEIVKNSGRINFVDIETIYSGEISHISHLRDIKYFIEVIVKNFVNNWRKK